MRLVISVLFMIPCWSLVFSQAPRLKIDGRMGMFVSKAVKVPLANGEEDRRKFKPGLGAELRVGYMIKPSVKADIAFGHFGADGSGAGTSIDHSIVFVNGSYYLTESPYRPYVEAGGGVDFFRMTYSDEFDNKAALKQTAPALNVGTGIEFTLGENNILDLSAHTSLVFLSSKAVKGNSGFRAAWLGSESAGHISTDPHFISITAAIVFAL